MKLWNVVNNFRPSYRNFFSHGSKEKSEIDLAGLKAKEGMRIRGLGDKAD